MTVFACFTYLLTYFEVSKSLDSVTFITYLLLTSTSQSGFSRSRFHHRRYLASILYIVERSPYSTPSLLLGVGSTT